MNAAGTFFLVVFLLFLFGAIFWVLYVFIRAKRSGLPAPKINEYNPFKRRNSVSSIAPRENNNIKDWFSDKFDKLRGNRRRGGEESHLEDGLEGRPHGRAGFQRLDDQDAWDDRVEGRDGYGREDHDHDHGYAHGHEDTAYAGGRQQYQEYGPGETAYGRVEHDEHEYNHSAQEYGRTGEHGQGQEVYPPPRGYSPYRP